MKWEKKAASARGQPSTVALIVLSTFSELETSDESMETAFC
jgi:hypothetical protein